MTPDETAKMIDAVTAYAELLGGLKNQIIAQGFSEQTAELMALEIIRKQ